MNTIRDLINIVENAQSQVDEMNRRDLIKGVGAAAALAGAGALGYKAGQSNIGKSSSIPRNPQVYYLAGYLLTALPPKSKARAKMFDLRDKMGVDVRSLPGKESDALDSANNKGLGDGYERLKYFVRAYGYDELKTDWLQDQKLIDTLERDAKPYYEKLQSLLTMNETSQEAITRVEQLAQK